MRKGKESNPDLTNGSRSGRPKNMRIRIREAKKQADPADPDPQHWLDIKEKY
jgi:hypothetical protein